MEKKDSWMVTLLKVVVAWMLIGLSAKSFELVLSQF